MAASGVPSAAHPEGAPAALPFVVSVKGGQIAIQVGGEERLFNVSVGGAAITDQAALEKAVKLMKKYLIEGGLKDLIKDETALKNVSQITVGPKEVTVKDDKGETSKAIATKDKKGTSIADFTDKLTKYTKDITSHIKYVKLLTADPTFKSFAPGVQDAAIKQLMDEDQKKPLASRQLFQDPKLTKTDQKVKADHRGLVSALNSFRSAPPPAPEVAIIPAPDPTQVQACLKHLQGFVNEATK